ncbi:MAG: triple tyrosine motif-containing protein [Microbacter sp.]
MSTHLLRFLKRLLFVIFATAHLSTIYATDFVPIVTNFTKKEYKASNQNWAVGQDASGFIYVGNNDGLLRYDGSSWTLFRIPGNRIVRSFYVANDGRIYVGSYEEFGYFEPKPNGLLCYHSLSQFLRHYTMQNDEIWSILNVNGKIYFQTFNSYFVFDGKTVTGYRTPFTFLIFNNYQNAVYTHVDHLGLCKLNESSHQFQPVITHNAPKDHVTAILPYDAQRSLLVTTTGGLYLLHDHQCEVFKNEANPLLIKALANRAVMTKDSVYVIGTILDGAIAINKEGKILWQLNTSNVLQNNTILGIYCDRTNNVWLALDKGISLIHNEGKVHYVATFRPSIGAIYDVNVDRSSIYIATNQGLYEGKISDLTKSSKTVSVHLVPQVRGQVWNLTRYNQQLFIGNNDVTYCEDENKISPICPVNGGFCLKEGIIQDQDVLVQGTYTQLCIYKKNAQGKWAFSNVVDSFLNPIRYLEIDYQGTIWASHLQQGLYRIVLNKDLTKIQSIQLYQNFDGKVPTNITVFKIGQRVVFANGIRFYTFDDLTKKIIPYDLLNQALGVYASAYRITHFKDDYYWFIRDDDAALAQVTHDKVTIVDVIHYASLPGETVDKGVTILPIPNDQCLICMENGLALYQFDSNHNKAMHLFPLVVQQVEAVNMDNSEHLYLSLHDPASLPFRLNSLIFNVAFPNYNQLDDVGFRYKLEGFDTRWSDLKTSPVQEYTRLPYGTYIFKAEVVSSKGDVIDQLSYPFEILPPFYLSWWAKLLYVLLVIGIIAFGVHRLKRFLLKKKAKIEAEHEALRRKEIEKREQQIVHLEKEKLETELTLKSKELANSTLSIIKKNDILLTIKEELVNQKKQLGIQYPKKYFEKLVRIIDENLSSEDDWTVFQSNFDRIHDQFFIKLHERYPELTTNDLRLCAYLRLNLTSKDIANLMNISVKGVEAGRSRLRKRLHIPSEKNLAEFMMEI